MSPIRFENLTTSQILHESICKVSESGLESFQTATFLDKFAFKCSCIESFHPRKKISFCFFFVLFQDARFWIRFSTTFLIPNTNITTLQVLNYVFQNVPDFELKTEQRVRFPKKNFLRRVSFWKDSCIWKKQVWNWSIYSSRQKMFCVMGRFFKTCFSNIYFIARQIVNGKVSTLSLFEKCLLSKIDVFTCFISVKTTFLGFLHFQKAYSELKSLQRFRIQIQIRNYIMYQFLNEVF